MKYKVGDSLKIITDIFEGIGVYKGATVLVVQECETEGQWLDRRGVEADALNTFANGKYFEFIEEDKVNKKFKEGDKVISTKNTPSIPEGFIGFIINDSFLCVTEYDYAVESINNPNGSGLVELFREDELELLSVGSKEKIQQLKEEARIIFDGLVDKDHPFNRGDTTPQEIAGDSKSALDKQIGGGHYKEKGIQPIEYIFANNLGFCEANIVKYATRWKDKNGIQDLEKIIHYTELLIELTKKEELKDKEGK